MPNYPPSGGSLGGAPSAPPTRDAQGNIPTTGGGQYDLGGGTNPGYATPPRGAGPASSYGLGSQGSILQGSHGGLDLGLSNRQDDLAGANNNNGYGQHNSEALGQYNGGANDLASYYSQHGAAAQGRPGEHIVNQYNDADRFMNAGAASQQQNALDYMRNAAEGKAPSQAQMQMQQGLDQSLSGQIAAANSTRGGGANMALAQRNAAATGSQMQNQVMGQSSALRAQEMAQARGAYSNATDAYRAANQAAYGQDQQTAFQQAGLNSAQRAQNDQYQQGYDQMGLNALQSQQSSDTAKYGADRNVAIANQQQQSSNVNAGVSAGAAALGAVAMMSDERLKFDVSSDSPSARTKQPSVVSPGGNYPGVLPGELAAYHRTGPRGQTTQFASDENLKTGMGNRANHEVDAFLSTLHPSSYRYKDAADEPGMVPNGGRYLGIMAQDVERGPTGDTLVKNTPGGKMIDVKPMVSSLAAGAGRLHERQNELAAELAALKAAKGKK